MLERRVELRQGAPAIRLFEKVREGVTEANDRVVLPVHVLGELSPVRMNGAQNDVVLFSVVERLDEHVRVAVRACDLKSGAHELHGVKSSPRSDVEDGGFSPATKEIDEKLSFTRGASLPVDELVPFFDERLDVFLLVMIRRALGRRDFSVVLPLGAGRERGGVEMS